MGSRDADQTLKIAKLCLKGLKGPFLLHNVVVNGYVVVNAAVCLAVSGTMLLLMAMSLLML